ncbi:MAG: hypothetical protein V2J13_04780 [Cycloclasticus sp.]|jgi:hypothetical protein|nr:hypothetical protein [Cycloclasticus sp.]
MISEKVEEISNRKNRHYDTKINAVMCLANNAFFNVLVIAELFAIE